MATPSDNDERADSDGTDDGDADAAAGETDDNSKTTEQKTAAEPTGSATEATVGRKLGDSTAKKSDKGAAIGKPGKTAPSGRASKPGAKRAAAKTARARTVPADVPPLRPKGGSLTKSVVLFIIVVGGLAAGFAFLGRETGGGARTAPSWKTGQTHDVELTLVKNDKDELTCAAPQEIAGRRCAQERANKPWATPAAGDDKKLLKPYTTTGGQELLAAGLWSEPALTSNLPATRFSVKCKFTVEGKIPQPAIRWSTDKPFYDSPAEWPAGVVTNCTVIP